MSYILAETEQEQKYFDFLEDLRQSGDTNMFGASSYLSVAFGLSCEDARKILTAWMKAHDDPKRILKKAKSEEKIMARKQTVIEVEREAR